MGFAVSGRRYSGWETGGDMGAMEEQTRRELGRSGLGFTLVGKRVSNMFDPTRAK